MAAPSNVLVLIHGMTPSSKPSSPFPGYESFWKALTAARPELAGMITKRMGVHWGHAMPSEITEIDRAWGYSDLKDEHGLQLIDQVDQKLTQSQDIIRRLSSFAAIQKSPSSGDKLIKGWPGDMGIPILRNLIAQFRENMVVSGIGDVVYYCSEEGETHVRRSVYHQILQGLDEFLNKPEVRFHIFAHSMGVTVAHDFLYGLFSPGHEPDFIKENQGGPQARDRYRLWRTKTQSGEVKLGSLASAASQLPLFLMRKNQADP